MSELFHLEFIECPIESVGPGWVDKMKAKGPVWDAIVKENELLETKLEEVTTFGAAYPVLNFKFQHVCSMNKSREFGFHKCVDTLKSVRKWVERLRDMNIIPKD